jgi:glycosyltransferase involved in cell wall biosynthesis
MPRVSIIIPNYNHARFLSERIESVLDQSFQDFEVIFLDDASTDNSLEVFKRYAGDARIRSIFNETNSGSPFKQWNKGLKEAQGEYIWIAESDDFADKLFLEKLVSVLNSHPEVGIAYSQSYNVDENSKVKGLVSLPGARWRNNFKRSGREELIESYMFNNTIPNASAVLFRTECYNALGGVPEGMRLAGDWYLWAKFMTRYDIFYLSAPLNYYRTGSGINQAFKAGKMGLDIFEAFDVLNFVEKRLELPEAFMDSVIRAHLSRWANISFLYKFDNQLNLKIEKLFLKRGIPRKAITYCFLKERILIFPKRIASWLNETFWRVFSRLKGYFLSGENFMSR